MKLPYYLVDVFASGPFSGNPLAVIDATTVGDQPRNDGDRPLSTEQMLRIANWMNLSETTFLFAPSDPAADYRVRIFTPAGELPFAGHPTLGTAQAWRQRESDNPKSTIVQQCEAGLVSVQGDGDQMAFAAPPLTRSGPLEPALFDDVCQQLGVDPEAVVDAAWIANGPNWIGVLLASTDEVAAVAPTALESSIGVIGLYSPGHEYAYEVRAFFPVNGMAAEDPATGSLNASAAQWLIGQGRVTPPYRVSQGQHRGRNGVISISTTPASEDVTAGSSSEPTIWVGGRAVITAEGVIQL